MKTKKTNNPMPPDYKKYRNPFDPKEDEAEGPISNQDVMDVLGAYDWTPFTIIDGDKIGLTTEEGEIILPPKVQEISQLIMKMPRKGDLFVARLNDKWGIIVADGKGKWIVEPVYDYIAYPNNLTKVEKDGKFGVLDISKNEFMVPLECDKIWEDMGFIFTNGIGYYEKEGKTGVIDESGRYTEAIFEDVDGEPEGLVKVKYNGKWGFVGEDNGFTESEEEAFYSFND